MAVNSALIANHVLITMIVPRAVIAKNAVVVAVVTSVRVAKVLRAMVANAVPQKSRAVIALPTSAIAMVLAVMAPVVMAVHAVTSTIVRVAPKAAAAKVVVATKA